MSIPLNLMVVGERREYQIVVWKGWLEISGFGLERMVLLGTFKMNVELIEEVLPIHPSIALKIAMQFVCGNAS